MATHVKERLTESAEINRVLAADLDATRRLIVEMSHEHERLQRDANAARARAARAERRNRALLERLRCIEREHHDIVSQLWKSSAAITEIAACFEHYVP